MKSIYICLILFALVAANALCNAQNLQEAYVNGEHNYSMKFPINWIVTVPPEHYHVVRCETPDTTLVKVARLKVMVMHSEDDLESIANKCSSAIREIFGKDITVNKKETVKINGIDFLMNDYSFNYKKPDLPNRMRNIDFFHVKNKKLYYVLYTGEEEFFNTNKDLIMQSINSFTLTK